MTETNPSRKRVSTSFNNADLQLILHLLAAADLVDVERLKLLRQHPRAKPLLARFKKMQNDARIVGDNPRVVKNRLDVAKSAIIMAEIRLLKQTCEMLPAGTRRELAQRYGRSESSIKRLVHAVNRQNALADLTANAAE